MNRAVSRLLPLLASLLVASSLAADDIDEQLALIRSAGPGGAGSKSSRAARDRLARLGPEILPRLLVAMDTPNIVAANWYRTIYEEITKRAVAKNDAKLPLDAFRNIVRDPQRQGRVRRLALVLLDRIEPEFRRQLVPTLLDDPEFRNDAVALAFTRGDAARKAERIEEARLEYTRAFNSARESGQVTQAADRLKSLGDEVSIVEHLGFITDWYLLGPFDAPGKTGFELVFPPENKFDLDARYPGKTADEIGWKRHQTTDRLALVNLNQAITPVKEAVGYAYSEFYLSVDSDVELRCGADDNLSVWLNGEKIFGRRQWLNGTRLDRFTAPAHLKAGKNRLLVKICQGPQNSDPNVPNNWSLQLRFCDSDGLGVRFRNALPELPQSQ